MLWFQKWYKLTVEFKESFGKNIQHEIYLLIYLSVQYSIVNHRHDAVPQSSRSYSSCVNEILYPLNSSSLFPLSPDSGNHHSTLCFYEFDYFSCLILVESCSICPSATGLFLTVQFKVFLFPDLVSNLFRRVSPLPRGSSYFCPASSSPYPHILSKQSFFDLRYCNLVTYSKFQIICSNCPLWIVNWICSIGTFQLR